VSLEVVEGESEMVEKRKGVLRSNGHGGVHPSPKASESGGGGRRVWGVGWGCREEYQ